MLDSRSLTLPQPIRQQLETSGLCLIHGTDTERLQALVGSIGDIRPHRDSDGTGATIISPANPAPTTSAASAFKRVALPPHTDGSGVQYPADLVVGFCEKAAPEGGDALFADGASVVAAMARASKWAFRLLSDSTAFLFGGEQMPAPVLSTPASNADDRASLRFRDDGELWATSFEHNRALHSFRVAVASMAQIQRLGSGDAYIADNRRILHGRTALSGDRIFVRYLVDAPTLRLGIPESSWR